MARIFLVTIGTIFVVLMVALIPHAEEPAGAALSEGPAAQGEQQESKVGLQSPSSVHRRIDATRREDLLVEVDEVLADALKLTVVVVDGEGRRQAGYPVNICKRSTDGAFLRAGPDKTHSAQADESGVARFAVSGGLGAGVGEDALCVASGLVWQTSAYTGLVGMLPGQVVELQVPTMGSLRVEVKDSKGDPWNSGCYVYVQAAQGEKWRRYAFGEREGAHWVHGLPLGKEYVAVAESTGGHLKVLGESVTPKLTQPQPRVALVLGAKQTMVRGRLLWANGEFAADAQGTSEVGDLRTGADGSFIFVYPEEKEKAVRFRFSRDFKGDEEVQLKLNPLENGGTIELGTVVLQERQVLFSGSFSFLTGEYSEGTTPRPSMGLRVEGRSDGGSWTYLETVHSESDGSFRSYGSHSARWLRLTDATGASNSPWYGLPEPVEVAAGSRNIQLNAVKKNAESKEMIRY